jgi:hypothetical protein
MTAPVFIYTSEPWAALFGRPIFRPSIRDPMIHSVFQTPPTAEASLPATIARIKVGGRPFYRHAAGLPDGRGK